MAEPLAAGESRSEVLLQLARGAIEARLEDPAAAFAAPAAAPWLDEPRGVYVTLWAEGKIRGCIGAPLPSRALGVTVWTYARAAAFQDLRFPPLAPAELPGVSLEVSVLSPLESLGWRPEAEVLASLRPGIDGYVLQNELQRGVFLPFMWDEMPTPERFLAGLKRKAELPEDFWGPEIRLWRFTVEAHREEPR